MLNEGCLLRASPGLIPTAPIVPPVEKEPSWRGELGPLLTAALLRSLYDVMFMLLLVLLGCNFVPVGVSGSYPVHLVLLLIIRVRHTCVSMKFPVTEIGGLLLMAPTVVRLLSSWAGCRPLLLFPAERSLGVCLL